MISLSRLACANLLSLAVSITASASEPAVLQLAAQFGHHPVIQVGEFHRSQETHAFLQLLLHDPAFICRADDVVVEFGNSRLQAIADKYAMGGETSEAEIVSMWRETVVPLTWNSPLYRQIYEAVRNVNVSHLCVHPVRLVLGDPPLDWSTVKTVDDLRREDDRDGSMARVVEREVLAKNRHALLITGAYHAWKKVPKAFQNEQDYLVAVQRIERDHPGAVFGVVAVPLASAALSLHLGPPPSFAVVKGTSLEKADFAMLRENWKSASKTPPELRLGEVVDGLLWLGGNHSLYPSPTVYLDAAYQKELRRRAVIIKEDAGQDFMPGIDELVRQGELEKASQQ
jgi:hypothetical protein